MSKEEQVFRCIKKILMEDWDPIGVADIYEAYDEYDSYIPQIYRMIIKNKKKKELFDYLWWVETEHMGLVGNREKTELTALKLCNINEI